MSRDVKTFAGRSKHTRPPVSRHFGVEYLEPRTVLSASPIVVIAIDAGVFADHALAPPHPGPVFGEFVLVDRYVQFVQTAYAPRHAADLAPPPFMKGLGGDVGNDRPATSLEKILPPPVTTLPSSSKPTYTEVVADHSEGEPFSPHHAGQEPQVPYANVMLPTRATDPVPVMNPARGATVDATVYGMDSQFAIGGWTSMISDSDWWYDANARRESSALDLLYGFRNSETTFESGYSDLQVGDIMRPASSVPETDLATSQFTWWLDGVLSDILPLLGDESTDSLPEADEGGLVDIGISAETLVLWNGQHAERAPAKRTAYFEEQGRLAHDSSWQEQEPNQQEQSQVVDPREPAVEVVRGDVPRVLHTAVTVAARADEEGGMIESLSSAASNCLSADEAASAEQVSSLETTEVRLDAEVGFYQAFELSTSPRASDSQAGVTVAQPRDER